MENQAQCWMKESAKISRHWQKENQHQSVNSRDCQDLKESVSTRQYTENRSNGNLLIYKLQSKVLELQKKIDQQKFQIASLTEETDLFMHTCEQQKKKLADCNVEMLRQEYEQQIINLEDQKKQISELIVTLIEEYGKTEKQQARQLACMKDANAALALRIEQDLNRKESLLAQIAEKDAMNKILSEQLGNQQERLDDLRNIQRKLYIALKQLELSDIF